MTRGRPIPASAIRLIERLRAALSVRNTAKNVGCSPSTVVKYTRRAPKNTK